MNEGMRHAVGVVALLNLAYFGVEFGVALMIGSVSLFADSIDFLEDASINVLILMALAWSTRRRASIGKMLAGIILIPGLATFWMAWQKFAAPMPPAPIPLSLTGVGDLLVNFSCAVMPSRIDHAMPMVFALAAPTGSSGFQPGVADTQGYERRRECGARPVRSRRSCL